ncbi:hypothetical protein [Actinomadura rupiterrae]|uniref:hypothetical protein n=1 Tax=Actinomadura rupiterrae TaxID=559627 RepID=UPI0020A2EFE1|nr:hypothetical protein [Actinomadura rupiterrae]MCP2337817.1 hypothetical protein [Actinomadura rupiterrae]
MRIRTGIAAVALTLGTATAGTVALAGAANADTPEGRDGITAHLCLIGGGHVVHAPWSSTGLICLGGAFHGLEVLED